MGAWVSAERALLRREESGEGMTERVTYSDDGLLDEIVAEGVDVHVERLGKGTLFLTMTRAGTNDGVFGGVVHVDTVFAGKARVLVHDTTLPVEGSPA